MKKVSIMMKKMRRSTVLKCRRTTHVNWDSTYLTSSLYNGTPSGGVACCIYHICYPIDL
jgi:hypothetical protein